jgi:hypothetical protein
MSKISPTIRIVVLVALVLIIYMAFQDFSPAPTTPVHHKTYAAQTANASGILPEDLNAHFPRYSGGKRDAFLPAVFPPNSGGQGDLSSVGKRGGWTLTGINLANGVPSALVEDNSTGNSAFLETGDHWNGLKVLAIGDGYVSLENAFGQQTRLSFPLPPPDTSQTSGNPGSAIPSLSQVTPLPALPSATASGMPLGAQMDQSAAMGGPVGQAAGRGGRRGGFGRRSN